MRRSHVLWRVTTKLIPLEITVPLNIEGARNVKVHMRLLAGSNSSAFPKQCKAQ
jgi:hypothetical protein